MGDQGQFDPSLERRLDAELRREMAAAEREAAILAAKRRTLPDVARAAVDRGDHITVAAGGSDFTGTAIYARGDLLTVRTQAALVEINLAAADWIRIEQVASSGGQASPIEAESFEARLGLLEITGEEVELLGVGLKVRGRIGAVARDHVAVDATEGRRWYIPIRSIACALRQVWA